MSARNFTLLCGIFFLVIGVLGFIPGIVTSPPTEPDPGLVINTGYGYLFGLFPTNLVHNLVHLAVGAWGITSARDPKSSTFFCQAFAILYSLIAVMGILPGTGTTFGLMPIFGSNVLLNLTTAAIAAYYGFIKVSGIDVGPNDSSQIIS